MAEPGAADRAKDDGLTLLSPDWPSEQADTKRDAENAGNYREHHAYECANCYQRLSVKPSLS